KVAMPEQRHFFFERVMCFEHPVGPPVTNPLGFENTGAQPVEKLVHDRLQWSVATGLDLDAQRFASLLGLFGYCRTTLRTRLEYRIVNPGMIECSQVVWDALKIDKPADGFRRCQFCESFDFLRGSAEAGTFQKMRGQIVVPVRRSNRREVILPPRRPGLLS